MKSIKSTSLAPNNLESGENIALKGSNLLRTDNERFILRCLIVLTNLKDFQNKTTNCVNYFQLIIFYSDLCQTQN